MVKELQQETRNGSMAVHHRTKDKELRSKDKKFVLLVCRLWNMWTKCSVAPDRGEQCTV